MHGKNERVRCQWLRQTAVPRGQLAPSLHFAISFIISKNGKAAFLSFSLHY